MSMNEKIVKLSEVKAEKKKVTAIEKQLTDEFKDFFNAEGIDTLTDEASGLSVVMSVSENTKINEEVLLKEVKKFIKENKDHEFIKDIKKCIKRVETVNEEQLEHLIRSGILDADILASATEIKYTPRVNVKKVKKGGN